VGQAIIHHEGAYNIWTTVADGPCYEPAMTLEQLTDLIRQQFGERGIHDLPQRLNRAHATGTSFPGVTLNELISGNRAGEHEAELTRDELIARYLTLPNRAI
jgi:hypothetical protein